MLIKKSFVENPLGGGVEEREEGLVHHLAIEPEVNSGDGRGFDFVEMRKRNGGNAHAIASAAGKKSLPENVDAEACVGAVEFFVEGADENDAPEAIDSALALPAAAKPFEHGDPARLVKLRRIARVLNDVEHSASDGKLIEPGERGKGSERASKMKRSKKRSRSYFAAAALRIKESEAVEEFDFV